MHKQIEVGQTWKKKHPRSMFNRIFIYKKGENLNKKTWECLIDGTTKKLELSELLILSDFKFDKEF
jgi:hypothetical protein